MADAHVAALIIPQGKVVDFIDGTLRNETPEEYVRQEIEKSIVREYLYPREELAVEFRIKMASSTKRVDIAIFPEGEPHPLTAHFFAPIVLGATRPRSSER